MRLMELDLPLLEEGFIFANSRRTEFGFGSLLYVPFFFFFFFFFLLYILPLPYIFFSWFAERRIVMRTHG